MTQITLHINGASHTVTVPPMKRLLDVLREDLHLTGAKEGCGEGECGSCSILIDRGNGAELTNSCLVPVLQAEGAAITTIEGLAELASGEGAAYTSPGLGAQGEDEGLKARPIAKLHPIQQCFLEHGGAQCGVCTPGMILATHHLLAKYPHPTLAQIQEGLAGNLCRCTGYMRIFAAVEAAAGEAAEEPAAASG